MQRNYFEMEQDAASVHIKQRAAMDVIRNEATIQSGANLFQFVSTNFSDPVVEKLELKRRKLCYVDSEEIVGRQQEITGKSTALKLINMTKFCSQMYNHVVVVIVCVETKKTSFSTEYIEEWNTVELKQSTQPSKKLQGVSHYLKYAMLDQLLKWPHKVVLLQLLQSQMKTMTITR